MNTTLQYRLLLTLFLIFALLFGAISWSDFQALTSQANTLQLWQLGLTSGFAVSLLVTSLLAWRHDKTFAYLSVINFVIMYLVREIFFLILMYQGLLDSSFYDFNFIFFGLVQATWMYALWLFPRHFSIQTQ